MARYVVYTQQPTSGLDADGEPIVLPVGTIVNAIVWDGETTFNPGDAYALKQSDTLQIGDMVAS